MASKLQRKGTRRDSYLTSDGYLRIGSPIDSLMSEGKGKICPIQGELFPGSIINCRINSISYLHFVFIFVKLTSASVGLVDLSISKDSFLNEKKNLQ